MPKWNSNRNGPNWFMDDIGRIVGYRDIRGGEHRIPQLSGAWGDAEALTVPPAGLGLVNGALVDAAGAITALSEVTAYAAATASATTTVLTGAGEYAGYLCTVAAGNITVYDNTAASGLVIVPTTALVVGAFPIFGAGTNGRLALVTGCTVVLSGAATVVALVQ